MPTTRRMTPFYRFAARGVLIPFLRSVTRQRVSGQENIPRAGGFIAVCNHLSDLDALTAMRALVDEDVPVYSLAKSTLFDVPLVGSVLRAGGQIPVRRATAEAGSSLGEAERLIRAGESVMVFPEGTLSRDPLQWPMSGKTGAARLAMATGAPVLPMGQWGAQKVLPAYSKRFHPFPRADVQVVIGEPLDLHRFGTDTSDQQQVRACTAEIMAAITALVEEIRGERAPRPFDMKYDGDPGKGRIGVRRPDPAPADPAPTDSAPADSGTTGRAPRESAAEPPTGPDVAGDEPGQPA